MSIGTQVLLPQQFSAASVTKKRQTLGQVENHILSSRCLSGTTPSLEATEVISENIIGADGDGSESFNDRPKNDG